MSERLPYEEQLPQQLRDFPLPDEDAAWADMKRRLDDDDDNGVIVWWKRGCAGWGLLLLGLIALGWWVLRDKAGKQEKSSMVNTSMDGRDSMTDVITPGQQGQSKTNYNQQKEKSDTVAYQLADTAVKQPVFKGDKSSPEKVSRAVIRRQPLTGNTKRGSQAKSRVVSNNTNTSDTSRASMRQPTQGIDSFKVRGDSEADSAIRRRATNFLTGDSLMSANKDSSKIVKEKDKIDSTVKKKDLNEHKEIFFSAGLGLFQQIPVAGQTAVPYSSQGRQFSWADYIPSVYVRLNKKDRWFVQGEFRYGAPQYTRPLLYFQKSDTNSTGSRRDTSKTLQKTYYHQLPFSFNYYVSPGWSVGAGLIWNKFSKSIYEESVQNPSLPPDSFLSKEIFTSKQPQAEGLSRSYFQGLVETQYQWRRFTFGARYAFGLAPYIKFTLPGEAEKKERNQSLQIFMRYEFFRMPKSK